VPKKSIVMMMMGVASALDIRVPNPSETRVHDERRTSLLARDATRARDVPRQVTTPIGRVGR
jgi:hypothetical protein|tara:strand:+ start:312 stop:497 length:186 start_codon:yes stop_codon:yes gene_type:complete